MLELFFFLENQIQAVCHMSITCQIPLHSGLFMVNDWNCFSESVIESKSLNCFKLRINKEWLNIPIKFYPNIIDLTYFNRITTIHIHVLMTWHAQPNNKY